MKRHHLDEESEEYQSYERDPGIKNQRCDACRIIAFRFDVGFEIAEKHLLPQNRHELNQAEVNEIVNRVCSKRIYLVRKKIKEKKKKKVSSGFFWCYI